MVSIRETAESGPCLGLVSSDGLPAAFVVVRVAEDVVGGDRPVVLGSDAVLDADLLFVSVVVVDLVCC
jgi:hypothetical protein